MIHDPTQILVRLQDGGVRVRCTGAIDLSCSHELRSAVDEALGLGPDCWIDLEAVSFIASSGIHELMRAHRRAMARRTCLLIAPALLDGVMRPFELLGLMELLPFAPLPAPVVPLRRRRVAPPAAGRFLVGLPSLQEPR